MKNIVDLIFFLMFHSVSKLLDTKISSICFFSPMKNVWTIFIPSKSSVDHENQPMGAIETWQLLKNI